MQRNENTSGGDSEKQEKMTTRNARLLEVLEELRALRNGAVEAVVAFYERLVQLENHEKDWRGDPDARTGYVTFEQLLRRENLCDIERYARVKLEAARVGWPTIRALGIDQVSVLLKVPEAETSRAEPSKLASKAIIDDALASKQRNGVAPSPRQMAAITTRHYVRPVVDVKPKPTVDERVEKLKSENDGLRKKVSELRARLEKTEKSLHAAELRIAYLTEKSKTAK